MEKMQLTGKLSQFNRYLPDLLLLTTEEATILTDERPAAKGYIVANEGITANDIFLKAIMAYLIDKVSADVSWSDNFKRQFNMTTGFTGIWYDSDFNPIVTPYPGEDRGEPSYYRNQPAHRDKNRKKMIETLDLHSFVDVETLMAIDLLPMVINTLVDRVGLPFATFDNVEGYNKKLGMCSGNWTMAPAGRNLIIIDVSFSIPIGIADCMLYLCSTLAMKMRADVIITGAESYFYPHEEAVALDPKEQREKIKRSNESWMFEGIICEELRDKKYHNIISFGDQDSPWMELPKDFNIEVGEVHHYHTQKANLSTGYAKWADDFAKRVVHNSPSWCTMFKANNGGSQTDD